MSQVTSAQKASTYKITTIAAVKFYNNRNQIYEYNFIFLHISSFIIIHSPRIKQILNE